jgi:hypothetical protein
MRYTAFYLVLCLSLGFSHCSLASNNLRLTLPKAGSLEPEASSRFYEEALRLALAKTTRESGPVEFDYHPDAVKRERARLLVKQGVLDILWSSSNREREEQLIAVKFNLMRGVNEYRLLLIRAADQPKFDQVKTAEDLQKFKIGSGTHWSDTEVYRFNRLPLVTTYSYPPMFRMLNLKRFDYMTRSLHEIDADMDTYAKLGLAIEKNLVIHYPQPIYFFVNDSQLAARIKQGLELAQQDGSLDDLFFSIPHFKKAWDQLQHLDRHRIELTVPE